MEYIALVGSACILTVILLVWNSRGVRCSIKLNEKREVIARRWTSKTYKLIDGYIEITKRQHEDLVDLQAKVRNNGSQDLIKFIDGSFVGPTNKGNE